MAVVLIIPRRFQDDRGWFFESWNAGRWRASGIDAEFVQDNHSYSREVYTLRGLHFQAPPYAQGKLVRCTRGRVWDVAVDLRQGSPTFGQSVGAELSAQGGEQLWIPPGFGHGFVTLAPDCEFLYKVTAPYHRESEGGLAWDDADLGVTWPLPAGVRPHLSARDEALGRLAGWATPFAYGRDDQLGPLKLERVDLS